MFPIHDQRGQVIGFGGRVMSSENGEGPKYLNSPETPLFQKGQELYGLFLARQAIRAAGCVVVVEGYMDVVALAQSGIEYAVATLGTATTPQHIAKLMRQTDDIIFCFDGDAAGRKAAWRAAINALPALTDKLRLSFLFLPAEHDPDSYVREFGRERFESEAKAALPLSAYLMQELSSHHDMGTPEGRVRFLDDAKPILQQLQAPKLNLMLRKRVAELAGVTQVEVESLLKLEAPSAPRKVQAKTPRRAPTLSRKLLLLLLIKPDLATQLDLASLPKSGAEFDALARIMELVDANPLINAQTLLQSLEGVVNPQLLSDLSDEWMGWKHEEFDVTQEFDGALRQLLGASQQDEVKKILALAQEKGPQALTPEQREILQLYRKGDSPKNST